MRPSLGFAAVLRALTALALALSLVLAACGDDDDDGDGGDSKEPAAQQQEPATESAAGCQDVEAPAPKPDGGQQKPKDKLAAGKTYEVVFETSCGAFTVELDQKTSPNTAASFAALVEKGFFDNLTFHRVVPGFVIQGGDPTGTGTGSPGYKTRDVPPRNARYVKGVVAMAKAGPEPPGTSGSQFYVVSGADAGLPPDYALLGKVTKGIETVELIDQQGVGDGPPRIPIVIEKATLRES
jgi:peptidyl-prolyl cis-trans isomerase B (cyclophilin B)